MKKEKIPESLAFGKITWIDDCGQVFERDLVEAIRLVKLEEQMGMEDKAIADYILLQLNLLYKVNNYNNHLNKVRNEYEYKG